MASVVLLAGGGYFYVSSYSHNSHQNHTHLSIVEGCLTIFISGILLLFLPGSPQNPSPLFWKGLVQFTERDCEALRLRLEAQNGLGARLDENGMVIIPRKVLDTVLHWRRWPHLFSTFAVFACWAPLTTYGPTIIM